MKKQKYYVVWKGVRPGIYNNWDLAKKQIDQYEGAKYKSYLTMAEAEVAFAGKYYDFIGKNETETKQKAISSRTTAGEIIKDSICVDAACSGNPGVMEYRGVDTNTGKQLFHVGPLDYGTNNVGEFLALVHALAYLAKNNNFTTTIYTDSRNAIAWVNKKNPKTKLERVPENKQIFELLERATIWLKNNSIQSPILHWQTEAWGEIPADFGRK